MLPACRTPPPPPPPPHLGVCWSASIGPVVSRSRARFHVPPPAPARHLLPRAPASALHVSALPFAGPVWEATVRSGARGLLSRHRQIVGFPLPRAAVILNRQEPEAHIYRETHVPEAAVGTTRFPVEEFL